MSFERHIMEDYQIQYLRDDYDKWLTWSTAKIFLSVDDLLIRHIATLREVVKDTQFRIVKVRIVKTIEVVDG